MCKNNWRRRFVRSSLHFGVYGATLWALVLSGNHLAESSQARKLSQMREPQDFTRLLTKGKLEADLGDFDSASEAFAAIAKEQAAPYALRWEALVRLGVARSAAGDTRASVEAFREARETYSEDPEAMQFLTSAVARAVRGRIWIDFKAEFEELLRTAKVVSAEELGRGVTRPKKMGLQKGEIELSAVWKPVRQEPLDDVLHEVAAYELDKILQLDMVPPSVERVIEGQKGALQLWVHGCKVYKDVQEETPKTASWGHQLSRAKMFDNLIGNTDRNKMNILVDPSWDLVLIDHTQSFSSEEKLLDPPVQFDRRLVEKLRHLNPAGLSLRLQGILDADAIEHLLERRDALISYMEQLIEERGEARVLF